MFLSFFAKPQKYLGIDIGTFSIKIVELSYSKKGIFLENYGEKINEIRESQIDNTLEKKIFLLSEEDTANSIKEILGALKIETKKAVFSIPDFMSFFTIFNIPLVPKEDIDSTVRFQAKQHIPLPLEKTSLDWLVIREEENRGKKELKILMVAVPNNIMIKYQKVARLAGIESFSVEAEVFSLARALTKKDNQNKVIQLIDIGIQSTTITISENNRIKSTYSINFSNGKNIRGLADLLNISYNEAEKMIEKRGIDDSETKEFFKERIDNLVMESNKVSDSFFKQEKKKIDKIIFSGGLPVIPGFLNYFIKKTGKDVSIAQPFSDINYPPSLNHIIQELGARYSVAIGLALRNINIKK